jgi:hypothetical protein
MMGEGEGEGEGVGVGGGQVNLNWSLSSVINRFNSSFFRSVDQLGGGGGGRNYYLNWIITWGDEIQPRETIIG